MGIDVQLRNVSHVDGWIEGDAVLMDIPVIHKLTRHFKTRENTEMIIQLPLDSKLRIFAWLKDTTRGCIRVTLETPLGDTSLGEHCEILD